MLIVVPADVHYERESTNVASSKVLNVSGGNAQNFRSS